MSNARIVTRLTTPIQLRELTLKILQSPTYPPLRRWMVTQELTNGYDLTNYHMNVITNRLGNRYLKRNDVTRKMAEAIIYAVLVKVPSPASRASIHS